MIKKFMMMAGLLMLCHFASAYRQKEVFVYSESMQKDVPAIVMTPDGYENGENYPVVYLLHGYSDNHIDKWTHGGHVGRLADRYNVMVVVPDGGYSSWYFDSPIMPEYRYETFVSQELVKYIDDNFKTLADRKGRAITGNSMGGHGALYLAIRHQDVFGSAGSMSGVVDIRPFPERWHISQRLGTIQEYPENWENNTVINMTHLIKPGFNIIFDCGTGDLLYEVNCNLHNKLMEAEIPHDFYVRSGQHNWEYWYNAVKYQFQFFNDRFGK